MKKQAITLFLFLYSFFSCQNMRIEYDYEVTNTIFNKKFSFPAVLIVDKKGQKIYSTQFGIIDNEQTEHENGNVFFLIEQGTYNYVLYANNSNEHIISDEIEGKKYLFRDSFIPINYQITSENKIIDNVQLTKAEAEFRGRKYIIWFDSTSGIKGGPWKFSNLPGIAYEIYDVDNLFRWTLKKIKSTETEIENPTNNQEFSNLLSYKEYPKIKYPSEVYIHHANTGGNYNRIEQSRDGLEKVFEWEK